MAGVVSQVAARVGSLHAVRGGTLQGGEAGGTGPEVLFTRRREVYAGLRGLECWDVQRNALRWEYSGRPVVAHPPCARWSRLASIHGRVGEDGGKFAFALAAVREAGGVLEHPAFSYAFRRFGLGRPRRGHWQYLLCGGMVTELDQSRYGHPLVKPTWLYVWPAVEGIGVDWGPGSGGSVEGSWREQREHTPHDFGLWLLHVADLAGLKREGEVCR